MAEETKKSGKGCLIALAAVGVLMILGYFGVMFFLSKAKTVVEGIAEGVGASPKMIAEVKSLNDDFPFEKPADNRISENQVQKFIAIKQDFAGRIKEQEAAFKDLDERTKAGEGGYKEAMEGFKILGEIRRDFLQSLKNHRMSPKEYSYLTTQIYQTYFAAAVGQMSESMETAQTGYSEQIAQVEAQLKDPNLTPEMREMLQTSLESYKQMMEQTQTSVAEMEEQAEKMPQENIALLNKYRSELEQLNTWGWEFWGLPLIAGAEEY
jgi:hypothetical protein